mmetsp:Transcript_26715/g.53461  ORF Transcript_26715/g.53461 Transcript_26715/m.53461 type:complete len:173 (-) Transcript_26715:281-799(-)
MVELLKDDFDKFTAKLDRLIVKDLKFAQSQVVHGLNAIKLKETDEVIKQYFISAEENARKAFFTVDLLSLKVEASKIRLYSLLHIHGFFRQDISNADPKRLQSDIRDMIRLQSKITILFEDYRKALNASPSYRTNSRERERISFVSDDFVSFFNEVQIEMEHKMKVRDEKLN